MMVLQIVVHLLTRTIVNGENVACAEITALSYSKINNNYLNYLNKLR